MQVLAVQRKISKLVGGYMLRVVNERVGARGLVQVECTCGAPLAAKTEDL